MEQSSRETDRHPPVNSDIPREVSFPFAKCPATAFYPIWLCNVSVNTTRKMISQLKSISRRSNFIVYRYMFRSSWDHHQAVYIMNTVKLTEISVWIHIVVQRGPIRKVVTVVENCALCYNGDTLHHNMDPC
jgi:hypothetical protein